jgi:hypothetical protein
MFSICSLENESLSGVEPHVLIDEPFNVKLAEHKLLARPVKAYEAFVFVYLALGVRWLNGIGAFDS